MFVLVHPVDGALAEAERSRIHTTLPERPCRVPAGRFSLRGTATSAPMLFSWSLPGVTASMPSSEGCSLSSLLSTNRKGRRGRPVLCATNQDGRRAVLSGDSISSADTVLDSSSRLLSQWSTKNLQACRGDAGAAA